MRTRYDNADLDRLAEDVRRDSLCILRGHLPVDVLTAWSDAFAPLLDAHVRSAPEQNRGAQRYYVTLPFSGTFADPRIVFDPDIIAITQRLVGRDMVMCQLATDTPLLGSEAQGIHRDSPGLFPEWDRQTPAYQLAVNFPLVDVTQANGPTEIALGTHLLDKSDALGRIERGEIPLTPVLMKLGDVVIRDVRHLHRGTANRTDIARPMVVIGFSRAWLRRPEVSIRVPQSTWHTLDDDARKLLRFEPIVADDDARATTEVYKSFAY